MRTSTFKIAEVICLAQMVWIIASTAAYAQGTSKFVGICEPSGGAFLNTTIFAVASDESNVIRLYQRGSEEAVRSVDLTGFLGYDKSDLEAASVSGDVVFWSASQSLSSGGKDRKRKVVFATQIFNDVAGLNLRPLGVVREDLKDDLVSESDSTYETINIEGLATSVNGGLYFGFRNLVGGRAPVVHMLDALVVLSDANKGEVNFDETAFLDLGGRGIRSMERIGDRYLIVAGPTDDDGDFGFFWWNGDPHGRPTSWEGLHEIRGLLPEVMMPFQDGTGFQIASDDGARVAGCPKVELEDPISPSRMFRSIDVTIR